MAKAGSRIVSLFLPIWPTDRLRKRLGDGAPPRETPLVLVGHDGRRRIVTAADSAASALGLRAGMDVAKAQALIPGLILQEADPIADAHALEEIALWALRRYAPVAAADPSDGLVLDVSGATHLFGGEETMLNGLIARLASSGFRARAALADTWGAAHALARWGARPVAIVAPGTQAEALAPLPIAALRLPQDLSQTLQALGFERIGDIMDAPRAPLAHRFGPELLRRLDQALGRLPEPIEPARPPKVVEAKRAFGEPIGAAETIARHLAALSSKLCAALEAKELGARKIDLLCRRVDGEAQAVRVGLARPTRDAAKLTRLLCEKIGTIDPGFGIESMSLAAVSAEPLRARQSALAEDEPPDLGALIDILANRLGEDKIYRLAPAPSEVPERSVRRIPPLAVADDEAWRDFWPERWPRPARLLQKPEPIEALAILPDYPPPFFTWRGERRRIARADGPERIFGEWRLRDAELFAVRDYFRVEDEAGRRYWIFRSGDGEDPATGSGLWFLHGFFA